MKKFLLATLALALSGSAFASETGDQKVNSYTYQSSTRPSVKVRHRAIPGPSSWIPPERIPSARVNLWKKDQPKKLGGGFSSFSGVSGFTAPTFSSPNFANPAFSTPTFSAPAPSVPTYSNPTFSSPNYSSPNHSVPGFQNSSFANPTL